MRPDSCYSHMEVHDKIYAALEARPDGLSLQMLARWLDIKVGTIKKNLERMQENDVVERVMRSDRFVYRLTR